LTARIVALASGGGRTIENLFGLMANKELDAQFTRVIVSQSNCGAADRCQRLGIPVSSVDRDDFSDTESRDQATLDLILQEDPDWVLLAGWLRLLPIPQLLEGKVLNIHPALLPGFGGKGAYGDHVHRAVVAGSRPLSGCTVHFASAEYDRGPILLQEAVLLQPNMNADQVAKLVFLAEKRAFPTSLKALISGQVRWEKGRVVWG